MSNEDEIQRIKQMNVVELLDYVIENPTVISDSSCWPIGNAVRQRSKEINEVIEQIEKQQRIGSWIDDRLKLAGLIS